MSDKLFVLLHKRFDEPHITLQELRDGLSDLIFGEEQDSPIAWGLYHAFCLFDDKAVDEDYVDGFVGGVLSVFAQCPIDDRVKTGSNNKVIYKRFSFV